MVGESDEGLDLLVSDAAEDGRINTAERQKVVMPCVPLVIFLAEAASMATRKMATSTSWQRLET